MDYLEVFFSFHICSFFSHLSDIDFQYNSTIIWNISFIIPILLNILRFILWFRTYLCESSMYTRKDCVVGWVVLLMFITSNWLMVLFSSYLSLPSFSLLVLLLLRGECQIL